MTALDRNPTDLGALRDSLLRRFDTFARRVRGRLLLEAAAQWLTIVLAAALVTFALDRWLRLSLFTRRGLLVALIAVVLFEAWRRLIMPLRVSLEPQVLAAALEAKARVPLTARVATVLQLPAHARDPRHSMSPAMIERAVVESHESIQQIDFDSHLDHRRRNLAAGGIAAMLLLGMTLLIVFPATTRLWAARLFAGSNQPWPQRTYLEVAGVRDGTIVVARGEPFALRVWVRDGAVVPDTIAIRWRQVNASRINGSLTRFGSNDFRYEFPGLQDVATLELRGGDDIVGPLKIRPVDRPKIVDLELIAQHPTEPQARTHRFSRDDAGDLAFLPLTAMELRFKANTPIADAQVRHATTEPAVPRVRRLDERQFALSWQHAAPMQLQIELVSVEAGLTSVPTSVSIGLKADKPPRVTLGFTGVRQRITPQATIPLIIEARDDYGVDRVALHVKAERADPQDPKQVQSSATTQPIFGPSTQPAAALETDVRSSYSLAIASKQLEPGHLLSVSATAIDACYTGAQSATSRASTFRIVRPEELFREILLRQQSERVKFRKQVEQATKLRDALAGAATSDAFAPLAREHRTIQREVGRIQTSLNDGLTEMRLNVLGTPEAHELMEKNILQRLQALDSDLMTPQRDILDGLGPHDPHALASAQAQQEQIVESMSEILRQMAQWDSFVEVLNQLNEIIRVQSQVQQGTDQLKRKQAEGAFDP